MDAYEKTVVALKALAVATALGLLVGAGAILTAEPAPTLADQNPAPLYTNPRWQDSEPVVLVPCASEDSVNCYWDASLRGNKVGQSFVNINGNVYYKPLGVRE